jgi:hypothetical protein
MMKYNLKTESEVPHMLGELLIQAIKNNLISSFHSPLNVSEVNKLAGTLSELPEVISLWELYNYVTFITSSSSNLTERIEQSASVGKYLCDKYDIENIANISANPTFEITEEIETDKKVKLETGEIEEDV